ncbi:uncharacterized protein MKK02DRAFT_39482 [Dioszegia hungarica]|uniref:Uncharacterized protein n=1 Tax=Dioszegia hungarica TaxID=4972 RepID=A0AA38HGN5_9TREE|nr:uncharacterized protein MKK02DRAFT_39482 [Dioszegia hungarica]KAI9639191.1 hypothetical protein MKK02DRAFT_39482 [Dioszegia hungarica]
MIGLTILTSDSSSYPPSPSNSSTPTSLSLPFPTLSDDLKKLIIYMADLPTLLSLIRVSHASNNTATPYIWRTLNLFVQSELGRRRYPHRNEIWGTLSIRDRTRDPAYVNLIRAKCVGIVDAASTERWKMVRSILLIPMPGALQTIVYILERCPETLESLEPFIPRRWGMRFALHPEWLEIHLRACSLDLHFPALTHVRIGKGTVHQAGFLRFLFAIAPNIIHLDAELHNFDDPEEVELMSKRKRMGSVPGGSSQHILDLVRQSSDLNQHSFGYEYYVGLIDLHACLPALEELYLDSWTGGSLRQNHCEYLDPSSSAIPSTLSTLLRNYPKLRLIHYLSREHIDSLFRADMSSSFDYRTYTGGLAAIHARSYVHGGDGRELLRAQIMEQDIDDPTLSWHDDETGVLDMTQKRILSTGTSFDDVPYKAQRVGEPVRRGYVEFEGEVVPLAVLREMLDLERREGIDEVGRGKAIGAKGWAVLMAWQAGLAV